MKKKCVILILMCMFNSLFCMKSVDSSSNSEDSCLLPGNNILCNEFVKREDWPFIPFNQMRKGIELLSKKSRQKIYSYKNPLSYEKQFLVSCIGTLPPEIINFIAYKMLDGRKSSIEDVNLFIKEDSTTSQDLPLQSLKKYAEMPFICFFNNYKKHENMFLAIPHMQDKSVGSFIGLSEQDRNIILRTYQPTMQANILFGTTALTEQELEKLDSLDEETRKEFFEEEEVIVLDTPTNNVWSRCDSSKAHLRLSGFGCCAVNSNLLIAGILKAIGVANGIIGGVCIGNLVVAGLILGGCWYYGQRKTAQVKRL